MLGTPGAERELTEAVGEVRNPAKPPMEELRRGRGLASYWMKEPYYMAKWTYFHRPSVWNRMSARTGFTWYGAYGFQTLMAGSQGIGYGGGARHTPRIMLRGLRAGAWGMERAGVAMTARGIAMQTAGPTLFGISQRGAGRALASTGSSLFTFARGFEGGGVGGGIRTVGETTAGVLERTGVGVQKFFGGAHTGWGATRVVTPRMQHVQASLHGLSSLTGTPMDVLQGTLRDLPENIGRNVDRLGIGAAFRPGRYTKQIVDQLDDTQRLVLKTMGPQAMRSISRSVAFRGATRLMAAGAVVSNVLLFGSILGKVAQAGTRYLGETAMQFERDYSWARMDFTSRAAEGMIRNSGAISERRRAMAAIQQSSLNARSYFGNEAALMHDS